MNSNDILNNDIVMTLEDIMADRFKRYSKYIILDRALPDARDGLKPVQRRILYAMYQENNLSNKPYRKSAKTVGIVIGNYHPHGDSSVYDAMVRLSQNWKLNHILIDIHGNNGSIDDDPAAAMRYTEARLSSLSESLLNDLSYNTVEMVANFDDTDQEPTILPSGFPLLLVNGATGIAWGYATNIAPHNLNEIIDACIYVLLDDNACIDGILEYVKGPDFPTGGIVQGKDNIKEIFSSGKGKVVIRSKTEVIKVKNIKRIIISEIPYEVVKSDLVRQIDDIKIDKKLDGIIDIRDESDRNGLSIVIDIKSDIDEQHILNYLYKNTSLQVYYHYNMVAIVNNRPLLCNILVLISTFINYRRDVVLKRSKYLLDKANNRLVILQGLIKAISIMDDIIVLIRKANDKSDAKKRIMDAFLFNELQAEAIVTMRLYRLTNVDILELKNEYAKLLSEVELLKSIIDSKDVLNNLIKKELIDIKTKYGKERSTIIEDDIEDIVIDKIKMVTSEDVVITLSKDGYIKQLSLRSFNAFVNQLTSIKDQDHLIGQLQVNTLNTLLVFTNYGNYAFLPIYQINEYKFKDIGDHLNTYCKLDNNEKIIDGIVVEDFNSFGFIISISAYGYIKKTKVSEYFISRNSKLSNNMKLKKDDYIVKVIVVYPNDELVILTSNGYCLRYNEKIISTTSNRSMGVKAIKLDEFDKVVDINTIKDDQNYIILFEDGRFKRIKNNDILSTNRAVKGHRLFKYQKSNPLYAKYGISKNIYEHIDIDDQKLIQLFIKDIPLMTKESSCSSVIELSNSYYYIKGIQYLSNVVCPVDYITTNEFNNLENEF